MSRVEGQPAYVLHRRPWRDSSLIAELFTPEHGRMAAVARGGRSPRSAFFGLLEPFRRIEVNWVRRGEMATLSGVDPAEGPFRLAGRALWCGLYANELLLTLTARDDPDPELFATYAGTLPRIAVEREQADALRRFEWALLGALGVAPDLADDGESGTAVDPEGRYRIDPVGGATRAPAGTRGFSGRLLLALARGESIPDDEHAAALRLMRKLLDHQLDGRRLRTPALFREHSP